MMHTDSDLLRLLGDEPPTPSAVDVGAAIAAGRRRKTTRRVYAATGAAVVVAAVALLAPAPSPRPDEVAVTPAACTVRTLALPGGVESATVLGSDRTGRYLAGRTDPAGNDPILWQDGVPRLLDFPGTDSSALTGVNSSGTAIGWGLAGGKHRPYVYRQGAFSPLPGAADGTAWAINDAGAITGSSGDAAVWWPSATADPIHLPVPDGTTSSAATGIDNDGTIIGHADRQTFAWRPDGTRLALPPVTIDGVTASMAVPGRISGDWVLGTAATGEPSGTAATFRWNLRTGEVQVTGDAQFVGGALNGNGWVSGTESVRNKPALVTGDGTRPLPLPEGAMAYASPLYTISEDARTVSGHVVDATGAVRPVLWTCG